MDAKQTPESGDPSPSHVEGAEFRESFSWRVRLSDTAPGKLVGIVAAAGLALLLGFVVFRSAVLGLAGFAIILGSTAEFWLGTAYTIDRKGATSRTGLSVTAIEWENVKRVIRDGGGIRLSPLERPGTMDAFRGVNLRYGVGNREDIEEAVLRLGGLRGDLLSGDDRGGDRDGGGAGGVGHRPAGPANPGDPPA